MQQTNQSIMKIQLNMSKYFTLLCKKNTILFRKGIPYITNFKNITFGLQFTKTICNAFVV